MLEGSPTFPLRPWPCQGVQAPQVLAAGDLAFGKVGPCHEAHASQPPEPAWPQGPLQTPGLLQVPGSLTL